MNNPKTKRDGKDAVHMHLSAIRSEMVDLAFECSAKRAKDAALKFIHTAESISRAMEAFVGDLPWDSLANRCRHATDNMRLLRSVFRRKRKRKIATRKNHKRKESGHEQRRDTDGL